MPEKKIKVRGVNLRYEGRGYHDVELELDEPVARHFINLGKAVEVQSEPSAPTASAPKPPVNAPSSIGG